MRDDPLGEKLRQLIDELGRLPAPKDRPMSQQHYEVLAAIINARGANNAEQLARAGTALGLMAAMLQVPNSGYLQALSAIEMAATLTSDLPSARWGRASIAYNLALSAVKVRGGARPGPNGFSIYTFDAELLDVLFAAYRDSAAAIAGGHRGSPDFFEMAKDKLLAHAANHRDQVLRDKVEALQTLDSLIEDLAAPERYRFEAAGGELVRRGPALVPALMRALSDKRPVLRANVAVVLGNIGPSAAAAIPALTGSLRDTQKNVRLRAAWALQRIGAGGVPQ